MYLKCMVKTITISDDVYEELLKIKGNKSFSEVIRELLRENNKKYVLKFFGIGWEEKKENKEFLESLFKKWTRDVFA